MAKFTVKNNKTGREYVVNGNDNATIDIVWLSQKCMFSAGCNVTITNENGTSKTFIKGV